MREFRCQFAKTASNERELRAVSPAGGHVLANIYESACQPLDANRLSGQLQPVSLSARPSKTESLIFPACIILRDYSWLVIGSAPLRRKTVHSDLILTSNIDARNCTVVVAAEWSLRMKTTASPGVVPRNAFRNCGDSAGEGWGGVDYGRLVTCSMALGAVQGAQG